MQKFQVLLTLFVMLLFSAFSVNGAENIITQGKYSISINSTPEWVKTTKPPNQYNNTLPDHGVRYLLKEEQFNFTTRNKQIYQRIRMEVTSAQGLKDVYKISIQFNPAFEKLTLHSINLIRNKKSIPKLDGKKIRLIQQEKEINDGIYSGYITSLILLEDIRVGDIIDYSFSISGSNPVLGDKKFGSFSLNYNVDVAKLYARILYKRKNKLYFTYHFNKKDSRPVKKIKSKIIELIWKRTNIKSVNVEDNLPTWFNPYDTVYFSEYKNWSEVSKWANSIYDFSYDKKVVDGILKELNLVGLSDKQKTSKILRFVQEDIRYLGLELGQNSHKPHPPKEVITKRFGDCKDKSLLMVALLKEEGIESYPALVSSYQGFKLNELQPGPSAFNHAITYVKLNGKQYWLDGTALHQKGDLDNIGFFNYYNALLVKPDQTKLTKVKQLDKVKSSISVIENISLKNIDEVAKLDIKTIYKGMQAENIRSQITNSNIDELSRYYFNYYAKLYPGVNSMGPIKITDNTETNQITINESYKINNFIVTEDNELAFNTYADSIYDFVQPPKFVSRKMPLKTYFPTVISSIINLSLPETIVWTKSSINEKIDGPNLKYSRVINSDHNKIKLSYMYRPLTEFVPTSETRHYTENLSKIKRSLSRTFYLPQSNVSQMSERSKKLKNLARELLKDN